MFKSKIFKIGAAVIVTAVAIFIAAAIGCKIYYSTPKQSPSFSHAGDAGSLFLENGYSVALDKGDAWDVDRGKEIVDANYDALYSKIYVASDGKLIASPDEHTYTVSCVLDHDDGIPPALDSNIKSDKMWIKDAAGNVTLYKKIKSVVTGDRASDDFRLAADDGDWKAGTIVLTKEYISSFADPDTVLVFITCKDDGREIFFWEPQN
ncbi:MAG: hypothetical protein PUF17_07420 [Lactimicrobium massiliense]|nr:hypothetical protein [Lactimicrobium massiliense]MDD6560785.1 hypothetical protein [Lactimicrobium massiliense]